MKPFDNAIQQVAYIIDSAFALFQQQTSDRVGAVQLTPEQWAQQRDELVDSIEQFPPVTLLMSRFGLDNIMVVIVLMVVLASQQPIYQHILAKMQKKSADGLPCLDILLRLLCSSHEQQQHYTVLLGADSILFVWQLLLINDDHLPVIHRELTPNKTLAVLFDQSSVPYPIPPAQDRNWCLQLIASPSRDDNPCCVLDTAIIEALNLQPVKLVQLQGQSNYTRQLQAIGIAREKQQAIYELTTDRWSVYEQPVPLLKDLLCFISFNNAILYWPDGLEALHKYPQAAYLIGEWIALGDNRLIVGNADFTPWPTCLALHQPLRFSLTPLTVNQQVQYWQQLIKAYIPPQVQQTDIDWHSVVNHYHLTPETMLQVCIQLQQIQQETSNPPPLTQDSVLTACQDMTTASLANVAIRVEPCWNLQQLVVAGSTQQNLMELIKFFQLRQPLRQAGIIKHRGLFALFWGQPGTGKTIAAEAVAKELALPLYQANLERIASKWIGETEKHLAALFDEAERNPCVLLIDEADALFAKRTQVESHQDKNSNLGVSFLLQRIETFNGVLLLASNYQENIDPAFLRRMHFSIQFKVPNSAQRLTLWQQYLGNKVQLDNAINLEQLANDFVLTGSNINNIALHVLRQAIMLTDSSLIKCMATESAAEFQTQSLTISKAQLKQAMLQEYQKIEQDTAAVQFLKRWEKSPANPTSPINSKQRLMAM
ncbi:ATP-binding protein [Zooshikella sp. RANM57]|uniref:ATP-binding protein n=1 Tax=Zooshikella sp. RANM57 TaxID=3425863 RepID=UPI003D6EC14B